MGRNSAEAARFDEAEDCRDVELAEIGTTAQTDLQKNLGKSFARDIVITCPVFSRVIHFCTLK